MSKSVGEKWSTPTTGEGDKATYSSRPDEADLPGAPTSASQPDGPQNPGLPARGSNAGDQG